MEIKGYSLAILGDCNVGKTIFALRYTGAHINNVSPTRGAEYFQKIFYYNKESIKLDIYDISGDKKYNKVARYLYSNVRGIILMYNVCDRNTFNNLENYLENIKNISVENPIIYIVGNILNSGDREINYEELQDFATEKNLKYYEISCKDLNDNKIINLMNDMTKDIIVTGKWYVTKIYKDLGDISSMEIANKDDRLIKELKIFNKDKKPKYFRCFNCEKLFSFKFNTMFNEIYLTCNCGNKKIVEFNELDKNIEQLNSRITCQSCSKKIDSRYKLTYCTICKKYFCPSCEKTHEKRIKAQGKESHKVCPFYLMDINCFNDLQKNIGFCKKCATSFCSKCFSNHKHHELVYFDDFVEQLIKENREKVNKEIKIINEFKKNCEDCINTLKKTFSDFIKIIEKEISLKDELLNQLTYIQYNYQLIETIRNFRYLKRIKYDQNSSWDQKLTDLFEAMHFPIQIKNINIHKNFNTIITPTEINVGNNIYNTNRSQFAQREVTDFCSMNFDKYIGISFSDGTLELYDNLIQSKEPLSFFQIFENSKINSMQKSSRNVNNFFICGVNRIRNIEFYDNYKSYRVINEIFDEDKNFQLSLEQSDYIITTDEYNKIELFNKDNKKIGDISDCIDPSGNKQIISLKEIMNNKIYITFDKKDNNNTNIVRPSGGDFSLNLSNMDDITMEVGEELNINEVNQSIDFGTKIIELENKRVIKQYLLPDKQEVLGVLNDSIILIRDDVYGSIILFDVNSLKIIQRFFWELGGNPVYLGILNKRMNLTDFILVDEKFNIFQNIFNEEGKNITQISGLKNKNSKLQISVDILKRGKIINNPFRSIVKYSGDNKFIVVNY